jgi:ABC-type amino acid transport substrate-binding protein
MIGLATPALLLSACGSDDADTGTGAGREGAGSGEVLKIATDATFPPFEFVGADNQTM